MGFRILIVLSITIGMAAAGAYTLLGYKTIQITIIKLNPFENSSSVEETNITGVSIEINPSNNSIKVGSGSGKVLIVEEAFPKDSSNCVERDKAEKTALDILLGDREARKIISDMVQDYGALIVEFQERAGMHGKICTGEIYVYPKDFYSRSVRITACINFVNRTLYLKPLPCNEMYGRIGGIWSCNKMYGKMCICKSNQSFREPMKDEREFLEKVLKEKGYKWDRISIAVRTHELKFPNGTTYDIYKVYHIILEPETSEKIYKAVMLRVDNDEIEELVHARKDVLVISGLD